ncbi:hypothetical protein OF829_01580 [Sphingomonas sp. LB-2]|uniref:hypothetical protein n=1 Tax=Sphingomonas caeni TaxID=2984949 RepID=UPI00222E676F|nr:hypothetical protein [Sphingomonas caeni]MCW3845914.1 hypothetical protein [Sphingomonas caeni]
MKPVTIAAAAIAILAATPAAAQRCWGVTRIGSNHLFVDLDRGFYIEYRLATPFMPGDGNPGNYRIHYSLQVHHDLKTDAVITTALTAETRDGETGKVVLPRPDDEEIMVRLDGGTALTDKADTLYLVDNGLKASARARAIHDRAMAGGPVTIRYRRDALGIVTNVEATVTFPVDPQYQREVRDQALAAAVARDKSGSCPFENRDN